MDIKDLVAPDTTKRQALKTKLKNLTGYFMIGIISLLVLFLVPLLNGYIDGDWDTVFPNDTAGWILYLSVRIGTALANVGIFALFKLQAKINVKEDINYKKAEEIIHNTLKNSKEYIPRSPEQMNRKEYIVKGTTIFIFTLLTTVTITSLILVFDFIAFLACIVSVIGSIVFGWVTMLKNEIYWTDEYLLYAEYISKIGGTKSCSNMMTKNGEISKSKSQRTKKISKKSSKV